MSKYGSSLSLLLVLAAPAAAQTPASPDAQTITCEASEAIVKAMTDGERTRESSGAPLWIGNGTEPQVTLRRLAELGSPALWFSPREFLLLEAQEYDSMPPRAMPADEPSRSLVYFRIRAVRFRNPINGEGLKTGDPDVKPRIQDIEQPWNCDGTGALPLLELDRVTIRYFFYYPEDRGVGRHFDDLEALELQLRTRWLCPARMEPQRCFASIEIESAAGSAHGVGWYTNVLVTDRAKDTVIPLTVLVEENKHASVPDRDGDGLYMPHYDVNRYSNDGWGIRDVAGTGKLGRPSYAADQARILRAFRPDTRILPKPGYWSPRLRYVFDENASKARVAEGAAKNEYELQPAWQSKICSGNEVNDDAIEKADRTEKKGKKLIELAKKLDFCHQPERTRVMGSAWVTYQGVSDVFAAAFPGPRNQYGFMAWPQRMAFSYRQDHGNGISYVGPFLPGAEMPLFGGWVVGKINYTPEDGKVSDLGRWSLGALYTPSASQSAAWYVAIGHEWRRYDPEPRRPGERNNHRLRSEEFDHSHGVVEEIGIKFRFLLEWMPVVKFWGARIGVRADGLRPIKNPRLVLEFGAGSW